jgi:hypothetical protein
MYISSYDDDDPLVVYVVHLQPVRVFEPSSDMGTYLLPF